MSIWALLSREAASTYPQRLGPSTAGFKWLVDTDAYEHAQSVSVRLNSVAENGVPFPAGWRIALQSLDLDDIVRRTVERVTAQSGVHGPCCRCVGHPLGAVLSEETENTLGAIAIINSVDHVLCAHIVDGRWLDHRGSIGEQGLCEESPLRKQDLIHVDLTGARLRQPPHKRTWHHLH